MYFERSTVFYKLGGRKERKRKKEMKKKENEKRSVLAEK